MKTIKGIMAVLLSASMFGACDNEGGSDLVIWDIDPIMFSISITDSVGNDLLDSTFQKNLIKDITVSYQDETYPVVTEREYYEKHNQTRAYMTEFRGLLLRTYWSHKTFTYGNCELVFGEFSGEENIDKREIILHLPGGRQSKLSYKNSFKWKSNGEPEINRSFYLDGKELKDEAGQGGYYNFKYTVVQGLEYIPSEIK